MPRRAATLLATLSILSSADLSAQDAGGTVVHPDAPSIQQRDWQREGSRERRFWDSWSDRYKAWRLQHYRAETQQAVAAAQARSAATGPLPTPLRSAVAAEQTAGEPPLVIGNTEGPIPAFISSPATKVADTARGTVEVIDQMVDRFDRAVLGNATPSPGRPGLFVLVLTAMFVIPSAGLLALFTGLVHLRAHSFRTGAIFLAVGGVILWAAISTALAFRAAPDGF